MHYSDFFNSFKKLNETSQLGLVIRQLLQEWNIFRIMSLIFMDNDIPI